MGDDGAIDDRLGGPESAHKIIARSGRIDHGAGQISFRDQLLLFGNRADAVDLVLVHGLVGPHADMRVPEGAIVVALRAIVVLGPVREDVDRIDSVRERGRKALVLTGAFIRAAVQDRRKAQKSRMIGRQGLAEGRDIREGWRINALFEHRRHRRRSVGYHMVEILFATLLAIENEHRNCAVIQIDVDKAVVVTRCVLHDLRIQHLAAR